MAKKALCVGINTYSTGKDENQHGNLKGCVNDATAWAKMLTNHFDFAPTDVNLMLEQEATKANMVTGLKELLSGAQADDSLVYTFSGHGTYQASKSQNQLEYDQAQCPADYRDNLLLDNELRELFYNLPKGVNLTVISDSCHSGSVTRKGKEALENQQFFESPTPFKSDDPLAPLSGMQLPRHLPPSVFGGDELDEMEFGTMFDDYLQPYSLFTPEHPEHEMNDLLLSGCNQFEFAMDVRFRDGRFGVLSYYTMKAIERANYQISFKDLHKQVRKWVVKYKFNQTPQLEGKAENKKRSVFG